jgi:AAA+ ATPase superfamily predicted ATPase
MKLWDRGNERQYLWKLLNRGKSINLSGARRIGKTHLLNLMREEAENYHSVSIFVDLQAVDTPDKAIKKIAEAVQKDLGVKGLWSQAITRIKDIFQGDVEPSTNTISAAFLKTDWPRLLDELLNVLDAQEQPVILLVDEISVCLSNCLSINQQSANELMRVLREHRGKYKNIRWVFTGSLGLDNLVKEFNIAGVLNDLEPYGLTALDANAAKAYVAHLCDEYKLPSPTLESHLYLQQRLNWLVPHYLQRIVLEFESLRDRGEIALNQDFDESAVDLICESLLSHPKNQLFADWPDHINRHYADNVKLSRRILSRLSQSANGDAIGAIRTAMPEINETAISFCLKLLEEDGYISKETDTERYVFVMGLLREYWQEMFGDE